MKWNRKRLSALLHSYFGETHMKENLVVSFGDGLELTERHPHHRKIYQVPTENTGTHRIVRTDTQDSEQSYSEMRKQRLTIGLYRRRTGQSLRLSQ
jgi:hypothetical protein